MDSGEIALCVAAALIVWAFTIIGIWATGRGILATGRVVLWALRIPRHDPACLFIGSTLLYVALVATEVVEGGGVRLVVEGEGGAHIAPADLGKGKKKNKNEKFKFRWPPKQTRWQVFEVAVIWFAIIPGLVGYAYDRMFQEFYDSFESTFRAFLAGQILLNATTAIAARGASLLSGMKWLWADVDVDEEVRS